jgi:hypothetical protein
MAARLEAENKRLRDRLESCPKTADGQPILIGMTVYPVPMLPDEKGADVVLHLHDNNSGDEMEISEIDLGGVYSSKAAALAGKEAKP